MTGCDNSAFESVLPLVATALRQRFGLVTNESRRSRVLAAMKRVVEEYDLSGPNELLATLLVRDSRSEARHRFLSLVTVHESFFFRDERAVGLLRSRILPFLVERGRHRRRLRVWSAGCANGEEAYTLAFILAELEDRSDFDFDILGTDLDARCVERAARARYGGASLRACSPRDLDRYFDQAGTREHEVKAAYRTSVRFAVDNIVDADLAVRAGPFDLVLCRNVAMYLDAAGIAASHAKIARNLAPDGLVLLGMHEPKPTLALESAHEHRIDLPLYRRACAGRERTTGPSLRECDAPASRPVEDVTRARSRLASTPPVRTRGRTRAANPLIPRLAPVRLVLAPSSTSFDLDSALERATKLADTRALGEALELTFICIDRFPLDPRGYALCGMVLEELGRDDEAAAVYRRALYLEPASRELRLRLDVLQRRLGRARTRGAIEAGLVRSRDLDAPTFESRVAHAERTGRRRLR